MPCTLLVGCYWISMASYGVQRGLEKSSTRALAHLTRRLAKFPSAVGWHWLVSFCWGGTSNHSEYLSCLGTLKKRIPQKNPGLGI
ncbi:hypothetical protein RB213_006517 [Colletotrichum asianum]